eukprot:4917333-Amphidinium_carterae.1
MDSPAQIAQYLLKGYCLLNEYCPNGASIPLLRHPNGSYLCVCGNAACKYASSAAPAGQKPSGVATDGGYPQQRAEPQPAPSSAPQPLPAAVGSQKMESQSSLPPPSRAVEVAVRGPELSFTCGRV